jgi:hypothetical protein
MKLRIKIYPWDTFKSEPAENSFWIETNDINEISTWFHGGQYSRTIPPEKEYEFARWPTLEGYYTIEELHFKR